MWVDEMYEAEPCQGPDAPEIIGQRWGSWKLGHKGRSQNKKGAQALARRKKKAAHRSRMSQKGKK